MFDLLYNSYNGNICMYNERASNEENFLKATVQNGAANKMDFVDKLILPGSDSFPFINSYKCFDCNKDDNTGCCKVLTVNNLAVTNDISKNYRIDVENNPHELVETHEPRVRFFSLDKTNEYCFSPEYQAYKFSSNVIIHIEFYKDGIIDTYFHNKKVLLSADNAVSKKRLVSDNGIIETEMLFQGDTSKGKIKVFGDYIGNTSDYIPTKTLSVNYVYIRG